MRRAVEHLGADVERVVMDQYTRRIVGFGVHRGAVDGVGLCRMSSCYEAGQTADTITS
jgi:hypothetical protein